MTYFFVKTTRFILCFLFILGLNFLLPRLMPGSPVFTLLGPEVVSLSQKDYQTLEHELGLDQPLTGQFIQYVSDLIKGDIGFSYYYHQPVSLLVGDHLKRSLVLLIPAVLLSSLLAALFGALSGHRAGSSLDLGVTLGFLLLYAWPSFLLAMVALDIFGFRLGWFPLGGLRSSMFVEQRLPPFLDQARHLFLPVSVVALSSAAAKYLVMRNSVAETRTEDYVLYARAKGIGEGRILFVHIFRNACLPLLSLIALHLGFVVSGSLLVEIVFSINGMGTLIYDAAVNRDYPVLQGCFMVLTLVVLTVNILIDLLYGLLDPRVRA